MAFGFCKKGENYISPSNYEWKQFGTSRRRKWTCCLFLSTPPSFIQWKKRHYSLAWFNIVKCVSSSISSLPYPPDGGAPYGQDNLPIYLHVYVVCMSRTLSTLFFEAVESLVCFVLLALFKLFEDHLTTRLICWGSVRPPLRDVVLVWCAKSTLESLIFSSDKNQIFFDFHRHLFPFLTFSCQMIKPFYCSSKTRYIICFVQLGKKFFKTKNKME